MRVVLSHPQAIAVANATAAALSHEGLLAAYFTGIAFSGRGGVAGMVRRRGRFGRILANRACDVRARELRPLVPVEVGARLAARALGRWHYDWMYVAHDAAVARLPWPRAEGVYAYEDAALATFRRAARRGMARVWDLPIPHWQTLAEMWTREHAAWPDATPGPPHEEPAWKRARKDEELALASGVVVASRFTEASVRRAGYGGAVEVVPYAFPVDAFEAKTAPPDGPFTVLAVGTHDLRKGTPYLLEAWRRAAIPEARLVLIGPMRLAPAFLARYAGTFEHVPHVPRAALGAHYRAADLFAFPTLGDGFGLVLQEAMCCGTPVLTTRCGGGPECVEEGTGWIVEERQIDPLVEVLRAAARDRGGAFARGRAARARAERWRAADAERAIVAATRRLVA